MRLFIGIGFNQEVKNQLASISENLRKYTEKGNFTRMENFHLTLAFLGDTEPMMIMAIQKAMDNTAALFSPFQIEMGNIGSFARGGSDIYWLGIAHNDALVKIKQQLDNELMQAGIAFERGAFKPHLTLARQVKLQNNFDKEDFIRKNPSPTAHVEKISLFESGRINGVLTYTEVAGSQIVGRDDSARHVGQAAPLGGVQRSELRVNDFTTKNAKSTK
jgi:2'-5' RNA ligase